MKNSIKLQTNSLLNVPFEKYNKDFAFIVNSERFETSSFFADLLSPKISQLHMIDPTIKEFNINTKTRGDFNKIIELIKFNEEAIEISEIPFITEIFEQIGTENVNIHIAEDKEENTIDNVIERMKRHQKHPHFYVTQLTKDIEFISSHFTVLKEKVLQALNDIENGKGIKEYVIEQIIISDKLQLETESELLDFVVELYKLNRQYSVLFESVIFENVEIESMSKFTDIFDFNDLTNSTWESLVARLQRPIMQIRQEEHGKRTRTYEKKSYADIAARENEFKGLMNYLQTHTNIKDEINITYSSKSGGDPFNLLQYEDKQNYFTTNNHPNSWICFEFKTHKIIPSSYIIRTYNCENSHHLKSWIFEGSNDNKNWTQLDRQMKSNILKGANRVHLFPIQNYMNLQPFKYLRIRQTGPNWCNNDDSYHYLEMNSIEFYGKLI